MARKTITNETRGGRCGTAFDDKKLLTDLEIITLKRIVLTHAEYVYSLAVSAMRSTHWSSSVYAQWNRYTIMGTTTLPSTKGVLLPVRWRRYFWRAASSS